MMTNRYIYRDPSVGIEFLSQVHFRFDAVGNFHTHPQTQFLWVLSGCVSLQMGSDMIRLGIGDVAIIPEGTRHRVPSTTDDREVELLDLRISAHHHSDLCRYIASHVWKPIIHIHSREQEYLVKRLAKEVSQQTSGHRATVLGIIWSLLGMLVKGMNPPNSDTLDRRITTAEQFMLSNLNRSISIRKVSEVCRLSVSQLDRLFRAHVGESPTSRLRNLRIQRAEELLVLTSLSIKQIASHCGFVCPNHFSRVFKSQIGLTPGQYRRRHAQQAKSV
jgi:AraC-like DNA-binding protein